MAQPKKAAPPAAKSAPADLKQHAQGSMAVATTKAKETTVQERGQLVRDQLEKLKPTIAKSILRHGVTADYVISTAMTALRTNPQLLECTAASLLAGILQSVQLGLRLDGPLGHAYLLPFRNNRKGGVLEAQFVPGYKGMIDLAYRNAKVVDISAAVVKEGDEFTYKRGSNQMLDHSPGTGVRGAKTHAYAYARLVGGGFVFTVLDATEIERRRAMSKSKDSDAWKLHGEKMWAKTALRDLAPWIPMSVELATAVRLDELATEGTPQELEVNLETGYVEATVPVEETPAILADAAPGVGVQVPPAVDPLEQLVDASEANPAPTEAVPATGPSITDDLLAKIGKAANVKQMEAIGKYAADLYQQGKITPEIWEAYSGAYQAKWNSLTQEALFDNAGISK